MLFLVSGLAAAGGVAVLLMVLVRLRVRARWLSDTLHSSRDHLAQRAGILTTRIAALRVALTARHRGKRLTPTQSLAA